MEAILKTRPTDTTVWKESVQMTHLRNGVEREVVKTFYYRKRISGTSSVVDLIKSEVQFNRRVRGSVFKSGEETT